MPWSSLAAPDPSAAPHLATRTHSLLHVCEFAVLTRRFSCRNGRCHSVGTCHVRDRGRIAISPFDVVFSTWRRRAPLRRSAVEAGSCGRAAGDDCGLSPGGTEKSFSQPRSSCKIDRLRAMVTPVARSNQTSRHNAPGLLEHMLRINFCRGSPPSSSRAFFLQGVAHNAASGSKKHRGRTTHGLISQISARPKLQAIWS